MNTFKLAVRKQLKEKALYLELGIKDQKLSFNCINRALCMHIKTDPAIQLEIAAYDTKQLVALWTSSACQYTQCCI